MSKYTDEEVYYGRVAFEAWDPDDGLTWSECEAKDFWIEAAKAARAAKYEEDPILAIDREFRKAWPSTLSGKPVSTVLAKRAYELGARAPKAGDR